VRFVSVGDHLNLRHLSGAFVSAHKIRFPGNGDWSQQRLGSYLGLMGRKAKNLVLLAPFGGQVGETGDAHAMRKSTVNRRFDEIRREERKRDRHVDLADTAPLSFGDSFGGGCRISCKWRALSAVVFVPSAAVSEDSIR